MTDDATTRAAGILLLGTGEDTMSEVAALAGVSRQAVAQWAMRANLDPVAIRRKHLEKLWRACVREARR